MSKYKLLINCDNSDEVKSYLNANAWQCVVQDIASELRSIRKYKEEQYTKEQLQLVDDLETFLYDCINNRELGDLHS